MKYLKLFEKDRFYSKSVENELKMCFDGLDDLELKTHIGYGENLGEFLVGITSQASHESDLIKRWFYITDDIVDEIESSCGKSEELDIKFISAYAMYNYGRNCTYRNITDIDRTICNGIIVKLKKNMPIGTYPW